ncbi:MAG: TlyA family RNA methyltransferase [Bdellovibrionales bacterium]|nr:TlyA family RNA methyltransferase [Bdellovibrionales bacterium]
MSGIRLDSLLIDRQLCENLEIARKLILAGKVQVDGSVIDKVGVLVPKSAEIKIERPSQFVGRGGEKLASAVEHFNVPLRDKIALDIGSSTGGFTDCLLQGGVALVFAVDVGKNQLDWSLRSDPRVKVFEGLNARHLESISEQLMPRPNLVTMDLSFISARQILPVVAPVVDAHCEMLLLVKPQFELPRDLVQAGGVVIDASAHQRACAEVRQCAEKLGWSVSQPFACPVRGSKKKNQEFFLHLTLDR